jgi:hypothetical protein
MESSFLGIPLPVFNSIGIVGLWGVVALMVITRRLVWHTDLRRAEARADRWEGVALKLLGVSEKLTVSAEVASAVLSTLPDPGSEQSEGDRS